MTDKPFEKEKALREELAARTAGVPVPTPLPPMPNPLEGIESKLDRIIELLSDISAKTNG